jgi:hypothetical protein
MDMLSKSFDTKTGMEYSIMNVDLMPIIHSDNIEDNVKIDYTQTRDSMKHLIAVGTNVIENLAKVAEGSESPRAYEVLANTLKTISEINESLLRIHKETKTILNVKEEVTNNNTTNNIVFAGTTHELQKLLKK